MASEPQNSPGVGGKAYAVDLRLLKSYRAHTPPKILRHGFRYRESGQRVCTWHRPLGNAAAAGPWTNHTLRSKV